LLDGRKARSRRGLRFLVQGNAINQSSKVRRACASEGKEKGRRKNSIKEREKEPAEFPTDGRE